MWLNNLKELKRVRGVTSKQIADKTGIPESTIKRIFSGETPDPYMSTIYSIVKALDSSLDYILTGESELEMLRVKITAQEMEIAFLKRELQHKEELLAVHNYYIKSREKVDT